MNDEHWYLLQTKANQERQLCARLTAVAADVLLPVMRTNVRRWGRMTGTVVPLFPCYVFARFDFEHEWRNIRYTRGLRGVLRFGARPAVVPGRITDALRERCARGPIEMPRRPLVSGESVRVIDGPLREFEGIFERRLSGSERIAILLSVMGVGARVVLPADMVVPAA